MILKLIDCEGLVIFITSTRRRIFVGIEIVQLPIPMPRQFIMIRDSDQKLIRRSRLNPVSKRFRKSGLWKFMIITWKIGLRKNAVKICTTMPFILIVNTILHKLDHPSLTAPPVTANVYGSCLLIYLIKYSNYLVCLDKTKSLYKYTAKLRQIV